MQTQKSHILIVDDDTRLRSLISRYLRDNDFYVSVAKDAAEARKIIKYYQLDALIVDIMMPNETGLEFLKSLRADNNHIPVIMLTAMGETGDRISGLELGADDYVAKPFEPKELVLRIQNVIKRRPPEVKAKGELKLGEYIFDVSKKELTHINGEIVHITPVEQALMVILGQKSAQVFTREKLAEILGAGQSPRSIDVQIARLRRKIEKDSKNPRYLQTVRGKGYMLFSD